MRPLTLKLSGLRSYRREQGLDFSDAGLMAIVGDTGAGKSSLLDGIFFALYGGCTWDRRAVVPLIADGENTMQVELVFLAEGRRWRVFRSASRTGTATRAELVCLDEPGERYDNSEPVTTKIRQLVGLDDDAFLRTVILPQGRFQALLQATRGDRTAILKGIFRLDQLETVRVAADQAARRIRPGVTLLREERAALLPDPAAALADAEGRERAAGQRREQLGALAERIVELDMDKNRFRERAVALRRLADRVRDESRPDIPSELAALVARAEGIDGQLAGIDEAVAILRRRIEELTGALGEAERVGAGTAALAAAFTSLRTLVETVPGLAEEAEGCTREGADLADLAETIRRQEAAAAAEQQAVDAEAVRAEAAAAIWQRAGEDLNQARRLLADARRSAGDAARVRRTAEEADALVEPAHRAVAEADREAQAALAAEQSAEDHLASIRRAHAAAHAAEGAHPGDPCPVCQQDLPSDFTAPAAPGDAPALAARHEAKGRVRATQAAFATARTEAAKIDERLRQVRLQLDAVEKTADRDVAALRSLLPAASLEADDEAILAPLAAAAASAEADARAAAARRQALEQQVSVAVAALDAGRKDLQRRRAELERRERSLASRRATCERAVDALPAGYRPSLPLEGSQLEAVMKQVEVRRGELAELEKERQSLDGEVLALSEQHSDLATLRRRDIDEPAAQHDRALVALAYRLGDLVEALQQGGVPARPDAGSLREHLEWGRRLTGAVADALASADALIDDQADRAARIDGEIGTLLETGGFGGRDDIASAQIAVAADLARATDDANRARDHLPRAAALEATIGKGGGLLEALDELTRLLTDGRFIGAVVAYKQKTLLAVASELLGSMTEGRYGFSEEFEIIDRLTGLPRGVKTLSGGETFLASLSLALGLVELAGRGGGRLDALFLDEGFASLDANSLAEALDALGQQAEGGRLVVVISHLRAVAEAMEHLVAVTRGPDGSRIRPLSGTDRDRLVEDDIEAGLLS